MKKKLLIIIFLINILSVKSQENHWKLAYLLRKQGLKFYIKLAPRNSTP